MRCNMKHFFKIIFLLILLLVIPISFASDNATVEDTIAISDNDEIISSNIYFNSSSSIDGDGSQSNPYNHLESSRLTDNTVAYFSNGEYRLDSGRAFNNLTIIGQSPLNTIIKGDSSQINSQGTLNIYNITLNGVVLKKVMALIKEVIPMFLVVPYILPEASFQLIHLLLKTTKLLTAEPYIQPVQM